MRKLLRISSRLLLEGCIDLPDEIVKDLSKDQAQSFVSVNCISKGQKSTALNWKLGKLPFLLAY